MDHGEHAGRPGDQEFRLAARAAGIAVVAALLAQVMSISSAPLALSVTFLLYLAALLAGSRAVIATSIGVWRRRNA